MSDDDEPPIDWQLAATCDPCKEYRHTECWGTQPDRAWLCVCELDRCLPPLLEEDRHAPDPPR